MDQKAEESSHFRGQLMEMYQKQHSEVLAQRTVAQHATKLTDIKRIATHTIVAGELVRAAEWVAAAKQQIKLARRDRVRRVVQEHLRSPNLRPTILCRLVGMSRSSLYRLLGDTGGVTRSIRIQRLLEARALLGDPSTNKPIAAIAEELCFADASSFARAFKREFGYSPSEARLEARAWGCPIFDGTEGSGATPRSSGLAQSRHGYAAVEHVGVLFDECQSRPRSPNTRSAANKPAQHQMLGSDGT